MTVSELIHELQTLNPNADVYIPCPHCCRRPYRDMLTKQDVHLDFDETQFVYLGSENGDCLVDDHRDDSKHTELEIKGKGKVQTNPFVC